MPMYDWRCNACNHVTEVMAKYDKRDQPVPCEECGSDDVDRQISGGHVQTYRLRNHGGHPSKHNLGEI